MTADLDLAGLRAGGLDGHGQARWIEPFVEPVCPFAEGDAVVLALVEEAAGEDLVGAFEAVQILVEEGQPSLVLAKETA